MQYLNFDLTRPERYGKFTWSESIWQASAFSFLSEAEAVRNLVPDATGVHQLGDKWYVIKE
jgi:hypothetical protein